MQKRTAQLTLAEIVEEASELARLSATSESSGAAPLDMPALGSFANDIGLRLPDDEHQYVRKVDVGVHGTTVNVG